MTWLLERLRRLPCIFRGHDAVLHFERDRLSLRCFSCGYQTPGWSFQRDVVHASSPIHNLSPRRMGDLAGPPVILDETSGSAFAAPVMRADRQDEASAARRPQALGDDQKSRPMRLAS
jgi:hypothetical protein